MAKPEWGVKRTCPNCGTRYYDMRKDPPICPSCQTPFDPEALLKSRRARPAPSDEAKKPVARVEDDEVETEIEDGEVAPDTAGEEGAVVEIETEGEESHDDDLIEDTSELGEDDMDEVVDVDGPSHEDEEH